jgi:hypothetical protein
MPTAWLPCPGKEMRALFPCYELSGRLGRQTTIAKAGRGRMKKDDQARLLGPWMTLALVIGGVVGSGIFYLPIALAPLGGSVPSAG